MKAWGIRVQWNPLSQGGTHLCYRSTIIMHIHHWWIPRYSLIFWYSYTSIWTTQMTIYMYPWCNDVVYIQVDLGLLSTYSSLIDTLVVITVARVVPQWRRLTEVTAWLVELIWPELSPKPAELVTFNQLPQIYPRVSITFFLFKNNYGGSISWLMLTPLQ